MRGQETSSNTATPVLEAHNLTKVYPPNVRALVGFSLALRAGEIHGLAGANGAGKSTAIKILTGVEQPTSGTIEMATIGEVAFDAPTDAARVGIGVVHQELPLLPNLTAAENVVLGIDGRGPLRRSQRQEALGIYAGLAERFPGAPPGDAKLEHLGLYAWQMVAIARALHSGARALILDEPTSSLGTEDRAALHRNLRSLADESGVAVLYVSHFLDDVLEVSDLVTVIRDGRVVAAARADDLDEPTLLRQMLGGAGESEVEDAPAARRPRARRVADAEGLRLDRIGPSGMKPIDLEVGLGERVGLYGLEGSGAPGLLEAVFGLKPYAGVARWRGRELTGSTRARIDAGLGFVSGDRKRSLIGDWSVEMNHALPWLSTQGRFRLLRSRPDRAATTATIEALAVKGTAGQPMRTLSGGNQQKIALGRWLGRDGVCMLADEPTHGVDAHGRVAIHELLRELGGSSSALLVHSTDPEELVALCERVVVLVKGLPAAEFEGEEITVDALEAAARSNLDVAVAA